MYQDGGYVFKRAETNEEFEQIHRLNYRTFVAEIPQHRDPGTGRLVDKFHDKNGYFVALDCGRVIGMISVHDQPPFSVADRLSDRFDTRVKVDIGRTKGRITIEFATVDDLERIVGIIGVERERPLE